LSGSYAKTRKHDHRPCPARSAAWSRGITARSAERGVSARWLAYHLRTGHRSGRKNLDRIERLSRTRCKRSGPYRDQEGERAIATAESVTVIGAGLAGLRTVERLRHRGYRGHIVLLGAEPHLPYDRPPLSKQVLRGERGDPWLRSAGDYADLEVEVRLGERALGLDAERRVLRTRDAELPYDVLAPVAITSTS
jgi:hypothetical protein